MIDTLRIFANRYLPKSVLHRIRDLRNFIDDTAMARPRQRFYSQFIQKGSLCFDVGANIGNRVKPFLALGARVVAIEPQKECCDILKKRFSNSIVIINKGLGAQEESRDFYVSDASTISTFSSDWMEATTETKRFEGYTWSETRRVEVTTLDQLIAQYGLPDFIKIDVEGFEQEVISGLSQPVPMLSFEYGVPEFSDRLENSLRLLQRIYDNKLVCNYAAREDMVWSLPNWLSVEAMSDHIRAEAFLATSAGDIYIRSA
ncbi:FkbM family methyltransferase [Spirosoma sp. KNUC1025]|uniref:FkbM family methyltransferase n=1 Tax=Spirosoma sp. KNUC1025 TaxID=2894082 RepID=UPI003862EF24|nr:FkbM family methyltransferase [Spirosoma sp. KNUC1025]